MSVPVTPLGVVGLIAVIYLMYIFANLSQRLGAVTRMSPHFRFFYAAMVLLGISMLARVIRSNGWLGWLNSDSSPLFYLMIYHIPFVIAIAISVGVAWYYWSWLFKEKLT